MILGTPIYLLNTLDEETALKVWESLQGMRIYFSTKKLKYFEIQKDYKEIQASHSEKLEILARKHELGKQRISEIVGMDLNLFDVDKV